MSVLSDTAAASFIAGSFTLASIGLTWYLRNRRSMRKVSAEEFIENFMKRQSEEIAQKDVLLIERDKTIRNLEIAVKKWSQKSYRYETMLKELRKLLKELQKEYKAERRQNESMREELKKLKETYEILYAKKFVESVKRDKQETT